MKVIYLAHPLSTDSPEGVQANLDRAKRWYRWACDTFPEYAFIANWILNCEVYDDANQAEREKGMERNFAVISHCDELWLVGGKITSGMREEAHYARGWIHNVSDFTSLGEEPPEKYLGGLPWRE